MRLALNMPDDVAMIADCTYKGDEDDPVVEFAIYRDSIAAGESDGRLRDEGVFEDIRVRKFFPGSGCGVITENGVIVYAEAGLQGFVGK